MKSSPVTPLWRQSDGLAITVIDQTRLPHHLEERRLDTLQAAENAIRDMVIRGAPLIGAVAAWGVVFALKDKPSDLSLTEALERLAKTRPTAVNLGWALNRMAQKLQGIAPESRLVEAIREAEAISEEDIAQNYAIGVHGLQILKALYADKKRPLKILTHCNAGALATVGWGTALAPLYLAHQEGLPIEVWVDETRPRNQGALTAWELMRAGIPHQLIVDNAGGHLMQHGLVDLVIVGADRVSRRGDVCNKIGTYLKALAARDNGVPFYAAVPTPTIDLTIDEALREIPIEERHPREVSHVVGLTDAGHAESVAVIPTGVSTHNPAFDVTPAHLVTGILTEKGLVPASEAGIQALFA